MTVCVCVCVCVCACVHACVRACVRVRVCSYPCAEAGVARLSRQPQLNERVVQAARAADQRGAAFRRRGVRGSMPLVVFIHPRLCRAVVLRIDRTRRLIDPLDRIP